MAVDEYWNCGLCTYENESTARVCGMCQTPRAQ